MISGEGLKGLLSSHMINTANAGYGLEMKQNAKIIFKPYVFI